MSITNPRWIALRAISDVTSDKPVTNHLCCGTVLPSHAQNLMLSHCNNLVHQVLKIIQLENKTDSDDSDAVYTLTECTC
jgi:hypothetical protein